MMGRPRQSLTSMLIEAVTERIQSGQYKRGDQLPTEKDMIEEFGVSRTVVREAIANLKASGLVSTRQGKGAFVLDEGVRVLPHLRGEPLAGRGGARGARAAHRHRVRGGGAGRPPPDARGARSASSQPATRWTRRSRRARTRSVSTSPSTARSPRRPATGISSACSTTSAKCWCRGRGCRRISFDAKTLQEYLRRISGEHHQIVAAIAAGDSDGARAALRMHLGGSRDRLAQAARTRA